MLLPGFRAKRQTGDKDIVRKGLVLFLGLSILAIVILVLLTANRVTWTKVARIGAMHALVIVGLILSSWFSDALRLKILVRPEGVKLSLWQAFKIVLSGIFAGAVTPSSMGGSLAQVYLLSRENLPMGAGWAMMLKKSILDLIFLFALILSGLTFFHLKPFPHVWSVLFPVLIGACLLYLARSPIRLQAFVDKVLNVLKKIKVLDEKRYVTLRRTSSREIRNFHRFFRFQRRATLGALICTVLLTTLRFLIAPALLWSFGIRVSIFYSLWLQGLLMLGLYVTPTPGGSGIAELGFAGLFASFVPKELLGVYAVLWRFFTNYLAVILGGIVLTGQLSREMQGHLFRQGEPLTVASSSDRREAKRA